MAEGSLIGMEVAGQRSIALRPPKYTDNVVLAANTATNITVPSTAKYALFAGNADFFVEYINDSDLTSGSSNLLITNDFAADSDWTKGTGWTIGSGVASSDGTQVGDSDLTQTPSVSLVEGRAYVVTFTVTAYTAGNITPVVGDTEGTDRSSAATFTETIIAGAGADIDFRADLDFIGSIDNVSVAPVAKVPTADVTAGAGLELNPTIRIVDGVHEMSLVSADGGIVSISYFDK